MSNPKKSPPAKNESTSGVPSSKNALSDGSLTRECSCSVSIRQRSVKLSAVDLTALLQQARHSELFGVVALFSIDRKLHDVSSRAVFAEKTLSDVTSEHIFMMQKGTHP